MHKVQETPDWAISARLRMFHSLDGSQSDLIHGKLLAMSFLCRLVGLPFARFAWQH